MQVSLSRVCSGCELQRIPYPLQTGSGQPWSKRLKLRSQNSFHTALNPHFQNQSFNFNMSVELEISLFLSSFLVTTVFGMLLVFALVVMPGIAKLNDGDYLRAFQVIDGIIQDKQPVFYFVWIGSVVATIVATCFGINEFDDEKRFGLIIAMLAYMVTQVTTFTINVPMNNRVKELEITYLDTNTLHAERTHFETNWCFWNWARTIVMGLVAIYLLYLVQVQQ